MKIKVDEKNKAIIAIGSHKGKRIKAVVVCKEPEFDVEFGKKLVKLKYKINLKKFKLSEREKEIRVLNGFKKWSDALISENNRNIDVLEQGINETTNKYFELLSTKFPNEEM